jgi:hypothetical protein
LAELADALDSKSNDQNPQSIMQSKVTTNAAESLSLPLSVNPQNDPDLARVIAAWTKLPEPIKAGILAMVGTLIR